ncbi:recombinase family protein [Prescottella equi]|uniref:recombinase family protein n=1 Tax=Rhodococcus hoagii TaxID=43767 RepID=UPI00111BF24C|nr:recombinase family protein [Prescottella equi]
MRAVIYTRVSSDAAGQGRSVAEQEAECRTVCDREGWRVAEVLCDNDIGASRHSARSRPEWNRLSAILQPGDVLVTWEASRAQRDLAEYVRMRDLCADRGVMLSYSGRLYDLSRGDDRFGTALDALIAEREAEQIRERVLRAKKAGAIAGRPNGRLPYGYRRVIDMNTGATKKWIPDEATAPVVREIAKRALAGESLWSISRDLTARGVPAPDIQKNAAGAWRPQRVRVMITSPTYAGLSTHKGQIVGKGEWEALFSEDDHHTLVAVLKDPARSTQGGEPKHLLSGIAKCGVCGAGMRYFGPKSLKTPRYICEKSSCVGRRVDRVEALATQVLFEYMGRPGAAEFFFGGISVDSEDATHELQRLRQRLDQAADLFADGEIDHIQLARVRRKLNPRIAEIEAKLHPTPRSPILERLVGPEPESRWIELTIREQREAIRLVLDITIDRSTAKCARTFNPRDMKIELNRRWGNTSSLGTTKTATIERPQE